MEAYEADFEICLGEGSSHRCLTSDTVYTAIFGVGCIVVGLFVSAILNLIDKSNSRKRAKEEGQTVDTPEIGVQITKEDKMLEKMQEVFETASHAESFTGFRDSMRRRNPGTSNPGSRLDSPIPSRSNSLHASIVSKELERRLSSASVVEEVETAEADKTEETPSSSSGVADNHGFQP